MRNKDTFGERIFGIINPILMIIVSITTLYPMLHVIFSSFSNPSLLMSHTGMMFKPEGFSLSAYIAVSDNPMIGIGYMNTLILMVVGVSLNILLTSLAAYVLSRKDFLWGNTIMFFIVFTMFFSGGLIPYYLTIKDLNIDNSLLALILPVAINTFNLIIMRTSFQAIPDSLEESAKIDGAGHFTILFRIVLPLSMATVAVMILYYGVGHWNSWFNAMIFIRDRKLYPLQLVLREILIINDTDSMTVGAGASDQDMISETIKYAVIVVSTIPILILYPFLQKYFVKGVMVGAIKG